MTVKALMILDLPIGRPVDLLANRLLPHGDVTAALMKFFMLKN